jgi:micrococcal nuclease
MKRPRYFLTALLLLITTLLIPTISLTQDYDYFIVKRVVDGDTLLLKNGQRVRLIGVDTPEVHTSKKLYRDAERSGKDVKTIRKLGKRASDFVKSLVKPGDKIVLKYDWQRIDKYGRILAYVYLEDGTFLNAEIIKQGYGHAYTRFPFKYMEDFRRYEREARENKRGLWGG